MATSRQRMRLAASSKVCSTVLLCVLLSAGILAQNSTERSTTSSFVNTIKLLTSVGSSTDLTIPMEEVTIHSTEATSSDNTHENTLNTPTESTSGPNTTVLSTTFTTSNTTENPSISTSTDSIATESTTIAASISISPTGKTDIFPIATSSSSISTNLPHNTDTDSAITITKSPSVTQNTHPSSTVNGSTKGPPTTINGSTLRTSTTNEEPIPSTAGHPKSPKPSAVEPKESTTEPTKHPSTDSFSTSQTKGTDTTTDKATAKTDKRTNPPVTELDLNPSKKPADTPASEMAHTSKTELQKALSPGSVAAITIIVIIIVLVVFGGAAYWKIRHSSYGRLLEDQDYGSLGNYNNPLYDDS